MLYLVLSTMAQRWTRLIRFTAVETGGKKIHLGQPVDPKVDGKSLAHYRIAHVAYLALF